MNFSSSLYYRVVFAFSMMLTLLLTSEVFGQETDFEKPNVEALQKQIDDLKSTVDTLNGEASQIGPQANVEDENGNDTIITWDPAPRFETRDGRFSFETNGRMIYDYGIVNFKDGDGVSMPADKINGTELRALEFGVRGTILRDFDYRLVTKFVNNEVEVKLAYVDYSVGKFNIIVGQTRTFTSLEKSTPSPNTSFSSRAAFLNALRIKPRVGVGVSTHGDNWTASGGYFFETLETTNSSIDDHNMITSRLTFSPTFDNGVALHFGTSFFQRNRNGNGFELGYSDRPFSHQGDLKPLSSQAFNLTSEQFYGFEFVTTYNSFALQSEFGIIKNKLSASEVLTSTDPTYKGGYLEISYFLTGGERVINGSRARFYDVDVKSPVGEGGIGEVKVAGRYDMMDFTHETFGNKQGSYIFGIDWYLNNYMKIQGNYAHTTVKNYLNQKTNLVNTFNLRFQIDW